MSEHFKNAMNGMETIRPEKYNENSAGDCDGAGGQNGAESIWSFHTRALDAEKALHSSGQILVYTI